MEDRFGGSIIGFMENMISQLTRLVCDNQYGWG
jgi:hypothetical protein